MRLHSKVGAWVGLLAGAVFAAGCATVPKGPSVMVLPGHGKSFNAFEADDATCRAFAARQIGLSPGRAAARSGLSSAAVGTAVGAAAGAAIGAATGHPGAGAAIGAGSGLLVGSASGADHAAYSGAEAQRRYDSAYMQCMYAKGNQIPVAGQLQQGYSQGQPVPSPGELRHHPPVPRPSNVPPPPPGQPPPPPPDTN